MQPCEWYLLRLSAITIRIQTTKIGSTPSKFQKTDLGGILLGFVGPESTSEHPWLWESRGFFQPQTQGLRFDLMNYSHELQRRNAAARTMMGPWDRCSVRCTNVDGTAGSSWRSWRSWRYSQKLSPVEAVKVGDGFVVKASLVSFLCTASSCFFRAIWARLERFNASSPLQRWQNSHALPL